jgi:hypothetical protein
MEVKKLGGKQSPSQAMVQRLIEERGFAYHVVHSVDEALRVVGYGSGQT